MVKSNAKKLGEWIDIVSQASSAVVFVELFLGDAVAQGETIGCRCVIVFGALLFLGP